MRAFNVVALFLFVQFSDGAWAAPAPDCQIQQYTNPLIVQSQALWPRFPHTDRLLLK